MTDRRRVLLLAAAALLGPAAARAQAPRKAEVGPGLIFARVRVNGREGYFLVDTGAPTSLVDTAFAARSNLRLGQPQMLAGGGGAAPGRIADDLAIQADGGPTLRLDPAVTDLAQIAQVFGHALDGVLGADYFARQVLILDYRAGAARFARPQDVSPPAGATPLHIVNTPYVRAAVQQGGRRVEATFQIDTGSNTAVSLWTPVARRAFPDVHPVATPTIGLGGVSQSQVAPLDRLEVGGRTLTNVPADFANGLRPDDVPRDYGGIIGGPAFVGQVLTIDYTRSLMWTDNAPN